MRNEVFTMKKGDYVYSDNYKMEFVNGAFGGVGLTKELTVKFFREEALPQESFEVDDAGVDKTNFTDALIKREVVCGITMTLDGAKAINRWLEQHIKSLEEKDE